MENHDTTPGLDPSLLQATAEDFYELGTPEDIGKLYTALAKAQADFGPVAKSKTVTIPGKYSFDYAPLSELQKATRQALAKHGLAFLQPFTMDQGGGTIRTIVSCGAARLVSVVHFRAQGDIKQLGGQTTYLRRYAMNALLGLDGDDDVDDVDASPDVRPTEKRGGRKSKTKKPSPRVPQSREETPFEPGPPGPPEEPEAAEQPEPAAEPQVMLTDDQKEELRVLAPLAGFVKKKGRERLAAMCDKRYGGVSNMTRDNGADLIEWLKAEIRREGGEVPGEEGRHG